MFSTGMTLHLLTMYFIFYYHIYFHNHLLGCRPKWNCPTVAIGFCNVTSFWAAWDVFIPLCLCLYLYHCLCLYLSLSLSQDFNKTKQPTAVLWSPALEWPQHSSMVLLSSDYINVSHSHLLFGILRLWSKWKYNKM